MEERYKRPSEERVKKRNEEKRRDQFQNCKIHPKEYVKNGTIELGDSKGEEEVSIEWQDYEITTVTIIRGEMIFFTK